MAVIEDFVVSKEINYTCIASSQNRFVLSNSFITINLSKYKKVLCFLCKSKKVSHSSFYENEQFLNSDASTYFTLFKSNFVNITLGNYGQVKTANLKVLLFIVTSGTILIEHEIFDPKKGTTKVTVLKLQLVYYVSSMQMHLLSTGQILQFGLRVEDNKSGSTFHDKSSNAILSDTPNLQNNIQIVRTCILKHNVPNSVSLVIKYLNFENLYHYFGHISDEIIHHVLNNIKDTKKTYFPTHKYICYSCTLGKIYQHSFLKNTTYSSKS